MEYKIIKDEESIFLETLKIYNKAGWVSIGSMQVIQEHHNKRRLTYILLMGKIETGYNFLDNMCM